jgi:hypothetical protein
VSEASVIDGVTSESYSLAVSLPDGRGYYCSTSVAGTGTVSSVNTFWRKLKYCSSLFIFVLLLEFMFEFYYCLKASVMIYYVNDAFVCRCVSPY